MQNTSWEKAKPWLWQIVLFILIGLIGWFGIRFLLVTIQEKMDNIQKLSVTREHREKQLEQLPDLEKQHELIKSRGDELDIILDKDHLVNFIEELESLAVSNQVAIAIESRDNEFLESKVTVIEKKDGTKSATDEKKDDAATSPKKGASKETGILTELPLKKYLKLTITLTGEYQSIVRYLHRLEEMPFALDVIGLNMKEKPEEGDLIVVESGTLNPFGEAAPAPVPTAPSKTRLEGIFEVVVYTKD
ncbi:MAG: hypothetical protein ACEQSB_02765 [Undibacterium sp.]